jgi:hypothetical protein
MIDFVDGRNGNAVAALGAKMVSEEGAGALRPALRR